MGHALRISSAEAYLALSEFRQNRTMGSSRALHSSPDRRRQKLRTKPGAESDPRVTASTEDLQREFSAASRCLAALVETAQAANEASQIDEKLAALELK